jgi:hypothetical protein
VTPGYLAKRTPSDPRLQPLVDELRESMGAFSQSQYGRSTDINQSTLDTALASALSAAGRVKSEHSWLKTQLQRFKTNGAGTVDSRA